MFFFTLFKMPKINELKNQFKRLFFHKKKKSSPPIYQISFTQFRYFYFLFIKGEEIYNAKIKFLAELLFGEYNSIDPVIFHNNLFLYCPNKNTVKFFFTKEFQMRCQNKEQDLFLKNNFIHYFQDKMQIKKESLNMTNTTNSTEIFSVGINLNDKIRNTTGKLENQYNVNQEKELTTCFKKTKKKSPLDLCFSFFNLFRVKPLKFMSKTTNSFDTQYTYICDCSKCNKNKALNKIGERTATLTNISEMEKAYKEIENSFQTKKLHIHNLKDLLRNFKVCEQLINIVCKYLEKEYQSTVIEFTTFKHVILLFSGALNEDQKKQLLFFLITNNNSFIKLIFIQDLFEVEYFQDLSKEYNHDLTLQDFININTDYFIAELFPSFDKINLIPFLQFNVIPKERAQLRECFHFLSFNSDNFDQMLNGWCKTYQSFNAIEINFITDLENYINLDNQNAKKPQLTYNKIGKLHKNNNLSLNFNCKIKEDFYIIPSDIFNYFNKWFGSSQYISLKKLTLQNDLPQKEFLNQIGYFFQKEQKNYLIQYSPIFCKLVTFNEIVEKIKESKLEEGIDENNVNVDNLHKQINQILIELRDSNMNKTETNESDIITEIDWNLEERQLKEKIICLIIPKLNQELSSFRQYNNLKDPRLIVANLLQSIKLYFFVHDEIRPFEELFKEKLVSDEIYPFVDIIILVDYIKPLPISKVYTYDLIKNNEIKERNFSLTARYSIFSNFGDKTSQENNFSVNDLLPNPDNSLMNSLPTVNNHTFVIICNIGNSCYINNVLHILLNSPIIKSVMYNQKIKIVELARKLNNNNLTVSEILLMMLDKKWNTNKERIMMPRELLLDLRDICSEINPDIVPLDKEGDVNKFFKLLLEIITSEIKFNPLTESQINTIPDNKLKYVNEEYCNQIGNVYWSDYIKKNASYILPLFSMQSKKILKCEKCLSQKMQFEISHNLMLSVENSKIITLNICLNRLPFRYKIYYDSINQEFNRFNSFSQNKKSIMYNLLIYYFNQIKKEESEIFINDYLPIEFKIEVEKTKPISWLIDFIRNITELELERNMNDNKEIEEIQEKNHIINSKREKKLTSFLIWGNQQEPKFYLPEKLIQDCFEDEEKVFIEEILNINGIRKIKENYTFNEYYYKSLSFFVHDEQQINNKNEYNFFHEKLNYDNNNKIPLGINEEIQEKINILNESKSDNNIIYSTKKGLSIQLNRLPLYNLFLSKSVPDDYSIIKSSPIINDINKIISLDSLFLRDNPHFIQDMEYFSNNSITYEFIVEIIHCYQNPLKYYFFEPFQKTQLKFKPSFLVFTSDNKESLTPIMLYDYIWEKYRKFLQTIRNFNKENLWWLNSNKQEPKKYRFCYPFCIKIIKAEDKNNNYTSCAYCYWYKFCSGCILNPFNTEPTKIEPGFVIKVEWCNEIVDLCFKNLEILNGLKCSLSKKNGNWHLTTLKENQKDNTTIKQEKILMEKLDNLIQYSLEEIKLDDIKCSYCNETKCISQTIGIHRAPEILVINLTRFKNGNENKKLNTFIKFPINGLMIKEGLTRQNIEYDLYGVINYIDKTEKGYYNCIIKTAETKWIKFNILQIEEVNEDEEIIVTSSAHTLIYSRRQSHLSESSVKNLIDFLIEKETNFQIKKFFENEPVIVNNKDVYFIKETENGMAEVGDLYGKYEVNLNHIQRCLLLANEK